ncbi:LuxR family transcriptional regulator [Chelativorans sp.]|uniref:LuxR family transcriptional regulator n=1 Tax=Chelativorans sp. TaxID=2203393 RepID=UPI002810F78E|nr:LuxR family transcriptional regulator [Chelativorans sp.]
MNSGRDGAATESLDLVEVVDRAASIEEAVFLLRDMLGLTHVTFHMSVSGVAPLDYPFVKTTYPPEWISRYVLHGYFSLDPVVRKGFSTDRPFAWHELSLDEREQEFMADSRAHGIGPQGYSIPIIDRAFRRSLLSLSADMALDGWTAFIQGHALAAAQAGQILHRRVMEELSLDAQPRAGLAPREIECLFWTARGKDAKAIAAILDLSEYTVRGYLRAARQKLLCRTLSQAVAKAVQQRIINP